MARVCVVTGKRTRVGNHVTRRGLAKKKDGIGRRVTGRSKRTFKPNIHTVRVLTQRVIDEIRAKHTKHVVNKATHRRDPVTDDRAMAEDLLDYLLVDWRGIVFKATRQPVPCVKEYKTQALAGARVEALFKLAGVNETERAADRAASFPAAPRVD